MNYTIIALVFVIIMMLYMMYFYFTNTSLTTGVIHLNDTHRQADTQAIISTKLVNPGAMTYHYEGWLFVNELPTTKNAIFWKDTDGLALCLDKSTLTVDKVDSTTGFTELVKVTDKFPQQKWVYFVVNVINKNVVEVYLNGKLIQTKQFASSVPNNTRGTLYLGLNSLANSTVDAYVTKFKRDPVALLPDQVWKTYLAGNGLATFSNWLAGYNLSFSISSGTEEIKKVAMFS